MKFKQVEWEKRSEGYFVANVAFGIQLTVHKALDKWVWTIGDLSYVFNHGESDDEQMAKADVEYYFYEYVLENIGKCTE